VKVSFDERKLMDPAFNKMLMEEGRVEMLLGSCQTLYTYSTPILLIQFTNGIVLFHVKKAR
jgi:hypothetical protein